MTVISAKFWKCYMMHMMSTTWNILHTINRKIYLTSKSMSSRSVVSNAQLYLCGTHALPSLVTNSDSDDVQISEAEHLLVSLSVLTVASDLITYLPAPLKLRPYNAL